MPTTLTTTGIIFPNETIQITKSTFIGYQTWQNVTASRSLGTAGVQTNNTARPIMVSVIALGGIAQLSIFVNSSLIQSASCDPDSSSLLVTVGAVVPAGGTYYCTAVNATLDSWVELR